MQSIEDHPVEDREDLHELCDILFSDESREEKVSAVKAMIEIFTGEPLVLEPMDLDEEPGPELQTWMDYVGGKIREYRKAAGMNQKELAKKSGIPQSHISRLENAKHSPSNITLQKIAKAIGIEVSLLDPSS